MTPNTRGYRCAAELATNSLYELQRAVLNNRIARSQVTIISKQLPAMIRTLLRNGPLVDSQPSIIVSMDSDSLAGVDGLSSALLRRRLLTMRNQINTVWARDVYKEPLWQEPEGWHDQLWKIKNPHLRGYRLKLLYKDIFSNERRFRFNLTDSPNCVICGQIETVAHQFVECRNAKNLWEMYRTITGKIIRSMLDVIICTESIEIEIAKTIIIKRLIQIDRSSGINYSGIKQEIKYYYQVEAGASSRSAQFWRQCSNRLDRI